MTIDEVLEAWDNDYDGDYDGLLLKLREEAGASPEALAAWLDGLDRTDAEALDRLGEVLWAVANDVGRFEEVLVLEAGRALDTCERLPAVKEAFSPVEGLLSADSRRVRNILCDAAVAHSRSPAASVRRVCMEVLGDVVDAVDVRGFQALKLGLVDPDWRVRSLAEESLRDLNRLGKDWRPPLLDRLRKRFLKVPQRYV